MGVITVSPPAPLLLYVVCFVLFLIILISPELTAQLTCINEDLLNKTVVEVYLILNTVRLSYKLRIDKEDQRLIQKEGHSHQHNDIMRDQAAQGIIFPSPGWSRK